MMNYKEARSYIDEAMKFGSVLGLESMRELLKRLDNPQDKLKFIHIAGTNGKGSATAYISTILKQSGYIVGRYVSPTIFSYRERIQINETNISKSDFTINLEKVKNAVEQMQKDGLNSPTAFEIETAVSFLYFLEKKCDIVVLETGLGGRLDATNVIKNSICEVIMSISFDHMTFLGNSLKEIAEEKAGIIKKNSKVILYDQGQEVLDIIKGKCQIENSELIVAQKQFIKENEFDEESQCFDYKKLKNLKIRLKGSFQVQNAATAVEAILQIRKLGFQISDKDIKDGLWQTVWKARFEKISEKPTFIIDGAHNQDASVKLRESIKKYYGDKKIVFIMGIFKDKDYESIIKNTVDLAQRIITIKSNNPRAMEAEELAESIKPYNENVTAAQSICDGVKKAYEYAGEDDVIIAFGSLSHLGEITEAVKEITSARGEF